MVRTTSLPMLLRFEDRNSMAHGVEARVPFLDYRLVETVMRFGSRFSICDGEQKWILRRAAAKYLPREIVQRRDKIGFSTPEESWLQGPLRSTARAEIAVAIEMLTPLMKPDR